MKKSKQKIFWGAVQPLVGSIIGVGIFGLPYVFAQAGFGIGLVHLLVVGLFNLVVLFAFADLIVNTSSKSRLTGVIRRFLGSHWSYFATIVAFASTWGAMIAYIIIGGEFLHAILSPLLGVGVVFYQIFFFLVSAVLLIGGIGFIAQLELVFVFILLIIMALVLTGSLPHADFSNLTQIHSENWFLPFGVVLFAFSGLAAIPEITQLLGKEKYQLKKVIGTGLGLTSIVYIFFAAVVVSVTGVTTTDEAVLGLGLAIGNWVTVLGSLIGLFSVFTSFLILGLSIMDTMIYDFKWRYLHSWGLAILVPLVVFLLGARSFIGVIGFTGGILGGLTAITVLYTYLKAKNDPHIPKRTLAIPNWLILLTILIFTLGMGLTIFATT